MKHITTLVVTGLLMISALPADANPNYRLRISYQENLQAKPVSWTLDCRPAGGTHPNAKLACKEIRSAANPFQRPPKNEACTKIYGGEEVARVTGIWAGKTIKRKFTRTDGCEISRWDNLIVTLSGKTS